jgi:hypothetical protein
MNEKIQQKNLPLFSSFFFSMEIYNILSKRETKLKAGTIQGITFVPSHSQSLLDAYALKMMGGYETVGRTPTTAILIR